VRIRRAVDGHGRARTRRHQRLVVGVLAAGVLAGVTASQSSVAAAAQTSKPTIDNPRPADPTNATAAVFRYTSSSPGTTFRCALDDAALANCPTGGRTFTGLSAGRHTFHLRALAPGLTLSDEATYAWTIDLAGPTTIPTSPIANARLNAAAWNTSACAPAVGICGTTADPSGISTIQVVVRRGAVTVVAPATVFSAGSAPPVVSTSWSLPLTLPGPDGTYTVTVTAKDRLGNTSTRTWSFVVDTTPPPAPVIRTGKPSDDVITVASPSSTADVAFTFTTATADGDGEDGNSVRTECALDPPTAAFTRCTSPVRFRSVPTGGHCIVIRTTDTAGNTASTTYCWSIVFNGGFKISTDPQPVVTPGVPTPIDLRFDNPFPFPITVSAVTITIDAARTAPCDPVANFEISQQLVGSVVLPGRKKTSLSELGTDRAKWPTLTMRDRLQPQDNCLGTTFGLTYSAQGVK
jgi:hypothetical protein